jgi:GNAT superfamily N-acetyltransferase
MFEPPPAAPAAVLAPHLHVMQSQRPTAAFYRFLYRMVGDSWFWVDRLTWSDDQLLGHLRRPAVELWVLYHEGTPAGYSELVVGNEEVNVAYFGLSPDYVGHGLGRSWLDWTLRRAWQSQPTRVWLNTCTLDHPAALPLYQKLGLQPYREIVEMRNLPEQAGAPGDSE